MVDWIVFYDDGSTFSSDDGAPEQAPAWGVMVIAARSAEHGRTLWLGQDFFWWDEDGEWVDGDLVGLIDYLARRPYTKKIVLMGRDRAPDRFHRSYRQALFDPRLPPKTSQDCLEGNEVAA
jgi:hypothetical protein